MKDPEGLIRRQARIKFILDFSNSQLLFWAYLVSGFSMGTSTDPVDLGDQLQLSAIKNAYFAILHFAKVDIGQTL
jgi:hypothetical protein